MFLLYNIFLLLASPIILLVLLAKPRCRRGLPVRWGAALGTPPERPSIWIHAVSLGEVVAAVPLVQALHARYAGYQLIVTTVTETGREAVEQRLSGIAVHQYAPLDFPWVVSRHVEHLNPALFLLVETELWPNLLKALAGRGVPAVLVNGRLSSNSYNGYRRLRPFMRRVLRGLALCLMQSRRDAERIIALGAPAHRVRQLGNLKFDQPLPAVAGPTKDLLLCDGERLLVAGSTHPGEDEQLLSCYRALLRSVPRLVLLLAPRHIERTANLRALVEQHGFACVLRSAMAGPPAPEPKGRVVILDTRGELAGVYRYAAAAFVGGTLVPVGGHNLLEPAAWSKPVYFGPYTDHCADVANLLIEAGGGKRVADGLELAAELESALLRPERLETMGGACRSVMVAHQGALQRTLEAIDEVMKSTPGRRTCAPVAGSRG